MSVTYLKITSVRIFSLIKKMKKEMLYYMICKSLIAKVQIGASLFKRNGLEFLGSYARLVNWFFNGFFIL